MENIYDMVTVICYGEKKQYERKQAIKEFRIATEVCEGHEKERYANVLCDLLCGKKVCRDGEEY